MQICQLFQKLCLIKYVNVAGLGPPRTLIMLLKLFKTLRKYLNSLLKYSLRQCTEENSKFTVNVRFLQKLGKICQKVAKQMASWSSPCEGYEEFLKVTSYKGPFISEESVNKWWGRYNLPMQVISRFARPKMMQYQDSLTEKWRKT